MKSKYTYSILLIALITGIASLSYGLYMNSIAYREYNLNYRRRLSIYYESYLIQQGDTLEKIATEFYLSPYILEIYNPNALYLPGESIVIPINLVYDDAYNQVATPTPYVVNSEGTPFATTQVIVVTSTPQVNEFISAQLEDINESIEKLDEKIDLLSEHVSNNRDITDLWGRTIESDLDRLFGLLPSIYIAIASMTLSILITLVIFIRRDTPPPRKGSPKIVHSDQQETLDKPSEGSET